MHRSSALGAVLAIGAGIRWGMLAPAAKLLFLAQDGTLFDAWLFLAAALLVGFGLNFLYQLATHAVFATYSYVMRRLRSRYPTTFATAIAWGGGFALVALAGAPLIPLAVAHSLANPDVAIKVLVAIVVISALLAPAAHTAAVKRANVTIATAGSQYAAIATGTTLSILVVHESLGPASIVGGLLLIVALALTLVPSQRACA